jgi:hypothetical protein
MLLQERHAVGGERQPAGGVGLGVLSPGGPRPERGRAGSGARPPPGQRSPTAARTAPRAGRPSSRPATAGPRHPGQPHKRSPGAGRPPLGWAGGSRPTQVGVGWPGPPGWPESSPSGPPDPAPAQDRMHLAHSGRRHRPGADAAAAAQLRVEAVQGGGVEAWRGQVAERRQDGPLDVALVGDPGAPGQVGPLQPALQQLSEGRVGGWRPALVGAWGSSRARRAWASRLVRAVPVRLRRLPVSGSRPGWAMTCQALPRWRRSPLPYPRP